MFENSEWERNAPLVIAHRGASAYAPENTLAAFKQAVRMKADAVELDAKLLKDGTIIILHDTTLDRTTDGSGSVYQYSYGEINQLNAGSHFSTNFSNEILPKLETIFETIGEEVLINIELTNYGRPWDRLPYEVIRLVRRYQLQKKVLLSSFNPWALIVAKRIDPEIPRALLVRASEPRLVRALISRFVDHMAFHPHYSLLSQELMEGARRVKRKVNVWTVNEMSMMKELIHLGVDGLITDFPDIAINALIESKAR